VKADEDMALIQFFCTCFQSNVVGKKRPCHTSLHMGLLISSHLRRDLVPAPVADLIPGTIQTEDLDKELGSIDIASVIEMFCLMLSWGIFIEGKAGLSALISVVSNERHTHRIRS